jgi:urea transport system substrate-binding protein
MLIKLRKTIKFRIPQLKQVLAIAVLIMLGACSPAEDETVRVGIIHSLTGTMADSESPLVDATLMAIEEINKQGGLLGRRLEPVVMDGASDWQQFADHTRALINEQQVKVIFGCWTSACRKTVKPIIEQHDSLLFYPLQYEGLEQSDNIIYTGSTPNQQIAPAIEWAMTNLGKRFYLVASDYVFPRAASIQMHPQITGLGGQIVGEKFKPLGSTDFSDVISEIRDSRPELIINTINGNSNVAFYNALLEAGISTPTLSFSISEAELQHINVKAIMGHYAAWSYFQSLPSQENQLFVKHFHERFGESRVTSDPMVAAYSGVHLWAGAVRVAESFAPSIIKDQIHGMRLKSPQGILFVSAENHHLLKPLHIGRANAVGQFDIVWSEQQPIRPQPYPPYQSKAEWNEFLAKLYRDWHNAWSAPAAANAVSIQAQTVQD